MPYSFLSSERTTSSANTMEARALLHLLGYDEFSDDIAGFAIDCFNDVTGMDNMGLRLYDIQSKAAKSGPADIGRSLVTLFNNYVSEFNEYFVEETLFLGSITSTVLTDGDLSTFGYSDMIDNTRQIVRHNLISECHKKEYVEEKSITDENIDMFLNQVVFVVAKQDDADCIKPLIKSSAILVPASKKLHSIFIEIRDAQSTIKNKPSIAGKSIRYPDEVYNYGRVLKRRDIELLVITRIINSNPLEAGIPSSFLPILQKQECGTENDVTEDCQLALSCQMFEKNLPKSFWDLLGAIVTVIDNANDADVETIYRAIDCDICASCTHLDILSIEYFIALVKDKMK